MTDWQPIETAPRHDCTNPNCLEECGLWVHSCLLFIPNEFGGVIVVGQCDAGEWLYGPDDDECYAALVSKPTHWMPKPERPK